MPKGFDRAKDKSRFRSAASGEGMPAGPTEPSRFDPSIVPEDEWQEAHSERIEHDPIDHEGPWRVASSGAGIGRTERLTLDSLPPFQVEVEVMGNPAVYGTVDYDPVDLMFVMGSGWLVDIQRGEGVMRSGDLLVLRKGSTIEELEAEPEHDVSRETSV